jgi:hypothetical protein
MLAGRLLELQHALNPVHLYCRIVDAGVNRELAVTVSRSYEALVFTFLSPAIKGAIQVHRFFYPQWGLEKELRKGLNRKGERQR